MHVEIKTLKERVPSEIDIEKIESIFFESSAIQKFDSNEKKMQFKYRWLDYYLKGSLKNFFYLAWFEECPVGYLAGCPDTNAFLNEVKDKYLVKFKEDLSSFPAHLHINCDENVRGKGIGQLLIKRYEKDLLKMGISGWHIITSPHLPNVNFYKKVGCTVEITKGELHFMGKQII